MSTSGRFGVFTMDTGRFFGDLRGMPYTAPKRQASGAIRMAFGRLDLSATLNTSATVKTDVDIGICGFVSPSRTPDQITNANASGYFHTWCDGSFTSGYLTLGQIATGQFSGQNQTGSINYAVIGYN